MDSSDRPGSAFEYKDYLQGKGFNLVNTSDYNPIKGDIIVTEPFQGASHFHKHGHIQMFNGSKWVSDFVQRDIHAGPDWRKFDPPKVIFRWK